MGNGYLNVAAYSRATHGQFRLYIDLSVKKKLHEEKRVESSKTFSEQPENNFPLDKQLWGIKCATAHPFYGQTFMQRRLVGLLDVCLGTACNMGQLNTQGKAIQVPTTNNYKHLNT